MSFRAVQRACLLPICSPRCSPADGRRFQSALICTPHLWCRGTRTCLGRAVRAYWQPTHGLYGRGFRHAHSPPVRVPVSRSACLTHSRTAVSVRSKLRAICPMERSPRWHSSSKRVKPRFAHQGIELGPACVLPGCVSLLSLWNGVRGPRCPVALPRPATTPRAPVADGSAWATAPRLSV